MGQETRVAARAVPMFPASVEASFEAPSRMLFAVPRLRPSSVACLLASFAVLRRLLSCVALSDLSYGQEAWSRAASALSP